MAHLYRKARYKKSSNPKNRFVNGKKMFKHERRFYTAVDMAIIKHDAAVRNSQIKRGEIVPRGNNAYISVCGCGVEGCFIHNETTNVSPERMAEYQRDKDTNYYYK